MIYFIPYNNIYSLLKQSTIQNVHVRLKSVTTVMLFDTQFKKLRTIYVVTADTLLDTSIIYTTSEENLKDSSQNNLSIQNKT